MERRGYPDQDIVQAGYKYHMNDIAATIGLEQLQYVSMNLNRARANAAKFDEAFAGLREIRPVRRMENAQSSCWLYTVLSPNRGEFVDYLRWHGIQAGPVHARNDHYSIFKESATELPGVDQFDREHVCIPVGWWLGRRDVRRIIDCVLAYEQMRNGARVAVSQSAARTEPAS
jgi:dTDP-4-amino-4,6-dideoxygalactose transaminase